MPKPLVSIIIPVYNAAAFINETINSALQQTWPNKEIIIVDDGSTDDSLTIAKGFESDTVKVFSQQNKGASAARNKGLFEAKGDYIQFLDADDFISENKVEAQMNLLVNNTGYISLCATIHFFNGEDPYTIPIADEWYISGSDDPVDFLIKLYGGGLIGPQYGGMIAMHAWLCPREVIDKVGGWNEELTVDDDGEFFCRVVLASNGIKYAPKVASYYRKFKDANTWSAQKTYESCKKMLQATQLKTNHLLAKTNDPQARLALSRLFWENAFNFYPAYKSLSKQAEQKVKELAPGYNYIPHYTGIKFLTAKVFGWRTVKYLQYIIKH